MIWREQLKLFTKSRGRFLVVYHCHKKKILGKGEKERKNLCDWYCFQASVL